MRRKGVLYVGENHQNVTDEERYERHVYDHEIELTFEGFPFLSYT